MGVNLRGWINQQATVYHADKESIPITSSSLLLMINNKTSPQEPQQLHDITLRLEHLKMRNCPEDMILALHCYTRAYRKFVELLGEQIEPESLAVFQLDHIEEGSVKLKNKVGYKPSITNFIGFMLTKLLVDDATDENLESKAQVLETETAGFIRKLGDASDKDLIGHHDPYVDRITLAEIMKDISDGGQLLMPKEHFEVIEESDDSLPKNVIKFEPEFRSHVSISDLKKSKPEPFNGPDTIIALRPCNVGYSSWYVESVVTKRKFFVRIEDSEWLTKYQSGRMSVVRANDLISVNLVCDVVTSNSGNARNVNAKITNVNNVEPGKFLSPKDQADMFE
ncbi:MULTISPECIES: hypothetical protein [Shewanella]|uniref:hypothetical protein n=1 Tax=Shewanella TaxID=22 RepID=UPI002354B429|nr:MULTISPECIES: hypothetical protein [Shewanella]